MKKTSSNDYYNQLLPIFNPITGQFLFNQKRHLAHSNGHWHKGVQANIIRKSNKGFDILVQTRSNAVDIGKDKYDQSLATQMLNIDNFSEINTLRRGLLEELSIKEYEKIEKLNTTIFINKTYSEDEQKSNQEILSLYIVLVNTHTIRPGSTKVNSLRWINWDDFLAFFNKNKKSFTKTSQFYFSTDEILKKIEYLSIKLINLDENLPKDNKDLSKYVYLHINHKSKKPITYKTKVEKILSFFERNREAYDNNKLDFNYYLSVFKKL